MLMICFYIDSKRNHSLKKCFFMSAFQNKCWINCYHVQMSLSQVCALYISMEGVPTLSNECLWHADDHEAFKFQYDLGVKSRLNMFILF